ncbi:uncharacterized protein LOC106056435 [Biomphalaria glabrata]|uniref:Uncharacterized protein LOC106056435 n=1 Tax=Biomphalaria glabrata TaxID=6526 RepID=A0A9W3AQY6_BIOGL|nr:uncharacterized protein LOC106056435 [Biomphalaria glabrata]
MELTIAANLALVSCIYLTLITSPASGYTWKCKGKWFIHACLGGNGKRSDPSLNTENNIPTSLLLRRVLESDPQQINQLLGERSRPELYEENQLTSLEEPSYRSVAEGEISQSPNGNKVDLETMRRYLEAFRLQRAIRESSEDFQ